uniref:hypothetical protein n=1 Tax=Streptomyces angustmyceticus TaxID=285578 RepID=UPI003CC5D564
KEQARTDAAAPGSAGWPGAAYGPFGAGCAPAAAGPEADGGAGDDAPDGPDGAGGAAADEGGGPDVDAVGRSQRRKAPQESQNDCPVWGAGAPQSGQVV